MVRRGNGSTTSRTRHPTAEACQIAASQQATPTGISPRQQQRWSRQHLPLLQPVSPFHRSATSISRAPHICAAATSDGGNTPAVGAAEDNEDCEVVRGREVVLGDGAAEAGSAATAGTEAGSLPLRAHLVEPVKNRNGSGVLVLTDILGFDNKDTRMFAYRLACFGYSVLVPDLFRGVPWEPSRPQAEYEQWRSSHPEARLATDIDTAARYLASTVAQPSARAPGNGRIALLGFCFGGGKLMEALARDGAGSTGAGGADAAVSTASAGTPVSSLFATGVCFYGTRFDPSIADAIRVPLLMVAGDSDPLCTVATLQEVARQRGAAGYADSTETRIYAGRGHAFAHRPGNTEEDDDAEDAFQATRHWLHEHLLGGAEEWGQALHVGK